MALWKDNRDQVCRYCILVDDTLTTSLLQPQLAYDMVKWARSIAVSVINGDYLCAAG